MKPVSAIVLSIVGALLTLRLSVEPLLTQVKSEPANTVPPLVWEALPSLSSSAVSASAQVVTVNGKEYVYLIGGAANSRPISSVYYAEVEPDGGIIQWHTTTPVSTTGIARLGTAAIGDQLFVIGGAIGTSLGSSKSSSTVYCAKPLADGSIQKWIPTTPISQPLMYHSVIAVHDRIYVIAGWNTYPQAQTDQPQQTVYSGRVPGNNCGQIEWREEISLPVRLSRTAATAIASDNGHLTLYVIGGWYFGSFRTTISTVFSTTVSTTGRVSGWYTATSLPITPGLMSHTAVASKDYVYILGGLSSGGNPLSSIYRAPINQQDGRLGEFTLITNSLPISVYLHSSVTVNDGQVYLMGGRITQNGNLTETSSAFFTPLSLFEKQSFPAGPVVTGDYITYTLVYTNNGLKQLDDLFVIDKIPSNTMIVRPPYSTGTQVIAWTIPILPITGSGSVSFTVQVQPRFTEARSTAPQVDKNVDKSILDAPNAVVIPAFSDAPARAETPAPGETPVSPASAVPTPNDTPTSQSKPVSAGPDCTPTGTPAPTDTPTGTQTPTSTETHTPTPTLTRRPTCTHTPTDVPTPTDTLTPTPVPGPALVTNFAWLCAGNFKWCITSNTTVNATHHVYLPVILKEATP